jgi:tRNA(Met) C34 N-acetyltransferase TmcA
MDDIQDGLRYLFQTASPYTLLVSGTGHAGESSNRGFVFYFLQQAKSSVSQSFEMSNPWGIVEVWATETGCFI